MRINDNAVKKTNGEKNNERMNTESKVVSLGLLSTSFLQIFLNLKTPNPMIMIVYAVATKLKSIRSQPLFFELPPNEVENEKTDGNRKRKIHYRPHAMEIFSHFVPEKSICVFVFHFYFLYYLPIRLFLREIKSASSSLVGRMDLYLLAKIRLLSFNNENFL